MSHTRRSSYDGVESFTYSEIESYIRVSGEPISASGVSILMKMDKSFLSALADQRAEQRLRKENHEKAKKEAEQMAGR